MQPLTYEPHVLYSTRCMATENCKKGSARDILCLQIDNSSYAFNENFMELERASKSKSDCKPVQLILNSSKLKFNGFCLSKKGNMLLISQPGHVAKLTKFDTCMLTKRQFTGYQARDVHIGAVWRWDTRIFRLPALADPALRDFKDLYSIIKKCRLNNRDGLSFVQWILNHCS